MMGLLQIMAQSGCYVPADSATFRLSNEIIARSPTESRVGEIHFSGFISEVLNLFL